MSSPTPKPQRGVSLYSYAGEYGVTMTLEDMFADIHDLGAHGLEILANSHIEGYPKPSEEWLSEWDRLIAAYDLVPVEYGHWVDSRRYPGREMTTQESYDSLVADIKLAHRLGFGLMRTKLGVIDETLTPVAHWEEFVEEALPVAAEYGVCMCPEIHNPTVLKSKMVDDYIAFIDRTGTEQFGLNIDFGLFQTDPQGVIEGHPQEFSPVSDFAPVLPYTKVCHAKFYNMTEDFIETTTPYPEVIGTLLDHGWQGYLLSEYEGVNKDVPGYSSDQLRKHHVMLKRLLGE
jgi:hypothetical protein